MPLANRSTVIAYLYKTYGIRPAKASDLLEREPVLHNILEHGIAIESFDYYVAEEVMDAITNGTIPGVALPDEGTPDYDQWIDPAWEPSSELDSELDGEEEPDEPDEEEEDEEDDDEPDDDDDEWDDEELDDEDDLDDDDLDDLDDDEDDDIAGDEEDEEPVTGQRPSFMKPPHFPLETIKLEGRMV